MSRYGDNREFMNDLSQALQDRAEQVGNRQALAEVFQVLQGHSEYYWADSEDEQT